MFSVTSTVISKFHVTLEKLQKLDHPLLATEVKVSMLFAD